MKLAAALFNSTWRVDINDVFWHLDADGFSVGFRSAKNEISCYSLIMEIPIFLCI